jgi:hypothetical protein
MTKHLCDEVKTSRRRLLKLAAATGGAVAASTLLPTEWAKPVIEAGLLPAHAQECSPGTLGIGEIESEWTGEECDCGGQENGAVLKLEFDACVPLGLDNYIIEEKYIFSGGTEGRECALGISGVIEPWGGGTVSGNGVGALAEAANGDVYGGHVTVMLCVFFDQRTEFTYKLTVCEDKADGDCITAKKTVKASEI